MILYDSLGGLHVTYIELLGMIIFYEVKLQFYHNFICSTIVRLLDSNFFLVESRAEANGGAGGRSTPPSRPFVGKFFSLVGIFVF